MIRETLCLLWISSAVISVAPTTVKVPPDSGMRSSQFNRVKFNGHVVKLSNCESRSVLECGAVFSNRKGLSFDSFWYDSKAKICYMARTNPGIGNSNNRAPEYVYKASKRHCKKGSSCRKHKKPHRRTPGAKLT